MIRLSSESDYNGLTDLWKEAFGDSEEAIRLFLDSHYVCSNTVVADEDGKIVSMLFLLEGKLRIKNKIYPSYYLYAAATAKSARGRGIMSQLLAFAKQTAFDRKVDFICLKPAEKSLYNYYSRFGYKTVFRTKTVRINRFKNDFSDVTPCRSDVNLEILRNKSFSETDGFLWNDSAINYAIKQHRFYGGSVLMTCNGFCLYSANGPKCHVNEFAFTNGYFDTILSVLNKDFSEITVDLPVSYDCSDNEGIINDNGMALAVTESAESVIIDINNAYLSLTLD